jgi:hypothetical protein
MYFRYPTDAELEGTGFTRADYDPDPVEIFEENVPAWLLFRSLRTQWREGFSGPTGLDMNVAFHKMDRLDLSREAYEVMEYDLEVMEQEALRQMHMKK